MQSNKGDAGCRVWQVGWEGSDGQCDVRRTFFGGRRCGKCAAAQLFARDVARAGRDVYVANATVVAAGTELGHFIGGAFNGGGSREGGHQMLSDEINQIPLSSNQIGKP